ncbi:MAG: nucleotide sugar dehydrogenase [Candidatus Hydrogenedentota bacterium]
MDLPPLANELSRKIADKTCVGGVIGLGYVGLPLVQHLCDAGYPILGFDIDPAKTDRLNRGESYIKHIDPAWIRAAVANGAFSATSAFDRLAEADCISICVPTPLDAHFEPDLHYVRATAESISETLRPGQLVMLESTTYPGTTEEILLPALERTGLKVGVDFFLAFSPEREDPANPEFTISTIPKVLGGITPACTELAAQYYGTIFKQVVRVSAPAVAELSKLLENIFRSVNIALVNELKMLCDRMGLDVWEVIDAAATKPFGFMPFYPGPGLGGHCIPIDPFYLSWKAREYGAPTRFIELAGQINTMMPEYVVARIIKALNQQGKPLKGAKVFILGAAYKKDVDDLRESPSLKLMELLLQGGAEVRYNDPHIPKLPPTRKYHYEMSSTSITAESLAESDCVLIATNHTSYDYDFIVQHAPLVVDTRNATRNITRNREKIVKA